MTNTSEEVELRYVIEATDPWLRRRIVELAGLILVEAIFDEEGIELLPSLAHAKTLVQREAAHRGCQATKTIYMEIINAGHDLAKVSAVTTDLDSNGMPVIKFSLADEKTE